MTIYDADYIPESWEQPGVKDPAAVDQEASSPQVTEALPLEQVAKDTSPDASNKGEESAPSDKEYNFRALREELATIKAEKDRLERDFGDFRHSQERVQRQPETPRKRVVDEINNDDLVTGAQFKQAMAEREAEYQLMLGELQVKSQHPDYDEVTAKYGVPLIEKEPDLAQGFLASGNKAAYLYKLGKMAMLAEQRPMAPESVHEAPQPSKTAQRIVENAKKPGTLSSPTGGAGNLSKADYYASMSDADFQALAAKNLAEI